MIKLLLNSVRVSRAVIKPKRPPDFGVDLVLNRIDRDIWFPVLF